MIQSSDQVSRIGVRTIQHLFPKLRRKDDLKRLQIDDESIHYISTREVASKITEIMGYHLGQMGIDQSKAVVTDATAGVGGDMISFAQQFYFVNGIELDQKRVEYLKNNLEVYGADNYSVYSADCTEILPTLDHNAVFFDPPWGGRNYKKYEQLHLKLGPYYLEEVVNRTLTGGLSRPQLVVLKLPKNFDLKRFHERVVSNRVFLYPLRKMDIVVVENDIQ